MTSRAHLIGSARYWQAPPPLQAVQRCCSYAGLRFRQVPLLQADLRPEHVHLRRALYLHSRDSLSEHVLGVPLYVKPSQGLPLPALCLSKPLQADVGCEYGRLQVARSLQAGRCYAGDQQSCVSCSWSASRAAALWADRKRSSRLCQLTAVVCWS